MIMTDTNLLAFRDHSDLCRHAGAELGKNMLQVFWGVGNCGHQAKIKEVNLMGDFQVKSKPDQNTIETT